MLVSDPHTSPVMVLWRLLQLQDQVHIHSKKKNGVLEFSAPACLLYKRTSPPSTSSGLSLGRTRSRATSICIKRLRLWVNSKRERRYQDWLSAGAGRIASLNQREVLLARIEGAGCWDGYWVGSSECLPHQETQNVLNTLFFVQSF